MCLRLPARGYITDHKLDPNMLVNFFDPSCSREERQLAHFSTVGYSEAKSV
jgi:hypothetical protein